jgi:flagellin
MRREAMAIINPNTQALSGSSVFRAEKQQNSAMERIGSGRRVNSAQDDPAALAIAMRFASQMSGNSQATRNIMDGVSLAQTAENGLEQVGDSIQRMRELAVQASNGTLNDSDRANLQAEYATLQQGIRDTLGSTDFNGRKVLADTASVAIQAGANNGNGVSLSTVDVAAAGNMSALLSSSIGNASGALSALGGADTATDFVSGLRAQFGADQSRLASAYQQARSSADVQAGAQDRLIGADMASETAALVQAGIQKSASLAMYAQANMSGESAQYLLNNL